MSRMGLFHLSSHGDRRSLGNNDLRNVFLGEILNQVNRHWACLLCADTLSWAIRLSPAGLISASSEPILFPPLVSPPKT
ncbi:hypothetical protein SLA2020_257660 [Shorea laevis]